MFNQNLEAQLHLYEKRLKELEIENIRLNSEIRELYATLKLTPEQIQSFLSNKQNFSVEQWKCLEELRKILEVQLQLNSLNHKNEKIKSNKTHSILSKNEDIELRHVAPTWLFVR